MTRFALLSFALVAVVIQSTWADSIVVPQSFDAREKWPNCVGTILEQKDCGSCWSFAAVNALSDRRCIFGDADFQVATTAAISPQAPLSCTSSQNLGCTGGYINVAWQYLADHGSPACTSTCTAGCLPYLSGQCTARTDSGNNGCVSCPYRCADNTPFQQVYKASSVGNIIQHSGLDREGAIMAEIFINGPVSACFTIYQGFYDTFAANPKGIYSKATETGANLGGHCTKIIGFGVVPQTGARYWIGANEWGTGWADGGYFKMARGENVGGIEDFMYSGCPAGLNGCSLSFPTTFSASSSSPSRPPLAGGWVQIDPENPSVQSAIETALRQAKEQAADPSATFQVSEVWVQPVAGLNIRVVVVRDGVSETIEVGPSKRYATEEVEQVEVSFHQTLDGQTEFRSTQKRANRK